MSSPVRARVLQGANILLLIAAFVLIDLHFLWAHSADRNQHAPEPEPIPLPGPDDFNALSGLLSTRGHHHKGDPNHYAHHHFFSGLLLPIWAFYMTPIIHVVLSIPLVILPFFSNKALRVLNEVVSFRFIVVTLLGILSYACWVAHHSGWAPASSIVLLIATSDLNIRLYKSEVGSPVTAEDALIYYPFSLLQGWTTVLVVWNAWLVFPHGLDTNLSRTMFDLTLLLFEVISLGYAFCTARGEIGGSIPITYALLTISTVRQSHFYRRSSIIATVASLPIIAKSVWTLSQDIRGGGIALPEAANENAV